MTDRICTECGTKVTRLYIEGDMTYCKDLMATYADYEYDDQNKGYTWYCTDESCNAGTYGWFGDRTELPPKADEYNPNDEINPDDEFKKLMKSAILNLLES